MFCIRGRFRGFRGHPRGPYGPPGMGRGPMGMMGGPPMNRHSMIVTHHAFDPLMAETHFGKPEVPKDKDEFNEVLLKKTKQLTPTAAEQSSVQNLVSKVCASTLSKFFIHFPLIKAVSV